MSCKDNILVFFNGIIMFIILSSFFIKWKLYIFLLYVIIKYAALIPMQIYPLLVYLFKIIYMSGWEKSEDCDRADILCRFIKRFTRALMRQPHSLLTVCNHDFQIRTLVSRSPSCWQSETTVVLLLHIYICCHTHQCGKVTYFCVKINVKKVKLLLT